MWASNSLARFVERAPSSLKDTVLLFHRYDTAQMIKAYNEQPLTALTSEGGLFDKLYQLYSLEDTLGIDVGNLRQPKTKHVSLWFRKLRANLRANLRAYSKLASKLASI